MTAFKGHGTYGNGVGVETPLDFKLNNAASVVKTTSPLVIRPGLFYAGTSTIVTGAANMSYNIAAYELVTQRSATAGVVFGGNDATLNLAVDVTGASLAAPGSNSRYDVIFHWHREFSIDGTDSNPVIGVVKGTAAPSPTVPSLASYPGAIELARVLVPAGVTATNSGTTFTQTAPFTTLDGGRVPFRNTTEMNLWTTPLTDQKAIDLSTNYVFRWNGSAWKIWEVAPVTYTPTWANLTVGNGTLSATFAVSGGLCKVVGHFTLGSSSVVNSNPYMTLPLPGNAYITGAPNGGNDRALGVALFEDAGNQLYDGKVTTKVVSSVVYATLSALGSAGTYTNVAQIAAAIPFGWGTSDFMTFDFSYLVD